MDPIVMALLLLDPASWVDVDRVGFSQDPDRILLKKEARSMLSRKARKALRLLGETEDIPEEMLSPKRKLLTERSIYKFIKKELYITAREARDIQRELAAYTNALLSLEDGSYVFFPQEKSKD